jgi:hypothetical protein
MQGARRPGRSTPAKPARCPRGPGSWRHSLELAREQYPHTMGQHRRNPCSCITRQSVERRTIRVARPVRRAGRGNGPGIISDTAPRSDPYIVGSNCRSAIATLVEHQTRYAMLVHLPDDHSATAVRDGLLATIKTLPEHLQKSLTKVANWPSTPRSRWPRRWTSTSVTPTHHGNSPWQRGSNENTEQVAAPILPKAPTFPRTHLSGCSRSRPSSTLDLARQWAASHPQKPCSVYCLTPKGPSLRRPPEFAVPSTGRSCTSRVHWVESVTNPGGKVIGLIQAC